jgi:hypothetical protein
MAFNGTRALRVGTYVTPSSGPHAGQLGPWHYVVEAIGVNPRGVPMRAFFAAYGWLWLGITGAFALKQSWAWTGMLIAAVGALWFLPFGTILGLVQIALLLAWRARLR